MDQPPNHYPYTDPSQTPPPPPYQYPQPGQYGPPPQQPGRIKRFTSWYMRQNILVKLIVAALIAFVVIFVGSAAIAGIAESNQADTNPTPTTAVASQPTSAPTQAVAPTPTTPPKPTPTPTVKQHIEQLVKDNTSQSTKIEFTQNDGKDVSVTITLSDQLTPGFARNTIQENCFNIEKALWTAHIAGLDDVNLAFNGPSVDKYGNNGTSPYGECDLTAGTAKKFNWDNLSASSAWDAYDLAVFFKIIQG